MKKEKLKDPKKKRMLLMLPLFIIPFVTMAFWALGGGKADASAIQQNTGLNLELPNAQLKDDRSENKLSYYERAEKDSAKWKPGNGNDLFLPVAINDSLPKKTFGYDPYPFASEDYKDPHEQKVYQKLAELNGHLQNSSQNAYVDKSGSQTFSKANPSFSKEDVDRLEHMMNTISSPAAKDPQVEQLNDMMERILDIQHPERVRQKINQASVENKEQTLLVSNIREHYSISLLDTGKLTEKQSNAFFGLDKDEHNKEQNAIEAAIHQTQDLVDGSIVKMRLLDDIEIGRTEISKGNFVFGIASLKGERLHIDINSVRKDNSIYPVKLVVYDLDGMEGVYIPGAITRDVAKQSADNSLQQIQMPSIDPSFKTQATAAGINAAKSLLTKKSKLVKVTVKARYKILLKEKNQ